MYYFKYNDAYIEKYIVRFNKDELIHLRNTIVNNCRELVHREIDTDIELSNNSRIRNLKQSMNGDIYHYSYDEYVYPELISCIDMLLKNDDRAIDRIYSAKQNDIKYIRDENKKNKLCEYYQRIGNMISFELLTTINFDMLETSKCRTRRVSKSYNTKK